jgi:uncharacterized protein YjbI with pentapeptide repeats
MADEEHLQIIRQGVDVWNDWRHENRNIFPDLREANLIRADLSGAHLYKVDLGGAHLGRADLRRADLTEANLYKANLYKANLHEASLHEAFLGKADLSEANLYKARLCRANLREAFLGEVILSGPDPYPEEILSGANLAGADLTEADLSEADLAGAILSGAILTRARLVNTNLRDATLTGSRVYGASVWGIKLNDQTKQQNIVITPDDEAAITVDNIEVAQFIYLLLNNQKIRKVIDTITSKAVLILGRFSEDRKSLLDAIRGELRNHNYLPILFDFTPSARQSTVETVTTLARMARFVIADLTDAKTVLQELQAIVPDLPSVAVRFLIKKPQYEPVMLDHIRRFPWVIKGAYEYEDEKEVITSIIENVIGPAEEKVKELRPRN